MVKNIGSADKVIRIILGLILISLYFFGPQTPFGLIGFVLIITALIGVCPAYIPFKISTIKKEEKKNG